MKPSQGSARTPPAILLTRIKIKKVNFEQSLADLNTEIAANPLDPEPLVERGNLWAEAGQYEAARTDYTLALTLAPDMALIWDNRGVVEMYTGDYYAALADFSQALTLDPSYLFALANRAYVYARLQKPVWALDEARRVLALDPSFAPAWDVVGQALAALGQLEESLIALAQAENLDVSCVQAPFHRAQVLHRLGRPVEALAALRHYLTMHDDQENARLRHQQAQQLLSTLINSEA